MAVSIAQYVDLLFKKLQGVAKTANSTVKSASNESIASPAFLRGDIVWMQSDQIPSTAQVVTGVTQAYTGGSSVQCTADNTVPPIGGIYPTWTTSVNYWVPQEFGSTWLPKVYVGPGSAANIQATGTQIFADGIGGVGEYYFDTQAGVLNFIGETIPTVLTAGNVVYVAGYQYVGDLGVTNIPSGANIGNLNFTDTTISSTTANLVTFGGTSGIIIPTGNIDQRPSPATLATIRFNTINDTLEIWDGTNWVSGTGDISVITNQTLNGDGSTTVFSLNQPATAESILVSINGILQTPGVDYTTSQSPDQITFTTAPAAGDVIQIRFISTTSTVSALYNGTSSINIPVSNGNAVISVGGTSNVLIVTSTGTVVNGTISSTGNITGDNINGIINTNSIVNSGSNGTGNIGSASTTFNTIFAKATSAQYADLAEFYSADAVYEPGTVLSFGGDREVTLTVEDADPCVAGVVSTNPSYIMNASIFAEFPTQVALTGRVPCRVVGLVTKGAMMVSAGNGTARAELTPAMGTVIGKALEAFDGDVGTIEIVVGRQ
jgi:hypothetical protein